MLSFRNTVVSSIVTGCLTLSSLADLSGCRGSSASSQRRSVAALQVCKSR